MEAKDYRGDKEGEKNKRLETGRLILKFRGSNKRTFYFPPGMTAYTTPKLELIL